MANNNGVTAQSVNARVDKMAVVFQEANGRLDALSELFKTHVKPDSEELQTLLIQIGEIDGELASYSAVRYQAQVDIITARADVQAAQEALEDIEANLYLNICAEMNDDGKLAYSNDPQRKAALRLAMTNQESAKSARAVSRAAEMALAKLQAQLDEIEERGRSCRCIYRALVARLENITARMSIV